MLRSVSEESLRGGPAFNILSDKKKWGAVIGWPTPVAGRLSARNLALSTGFLGSKKGQAGNMSILSLSECV
jgi:hypothetical protein